MSDPLPLDKQINALTTLINAARRGERFKPSEINFLLPRWEAALASLAWLQANEKKIKGAVSHASKDGPTD